MTLTINDLPPEIERRIKNEVARLGVDKPEYVKRLIQRRLPGGDESTSFVDRAMIDLLAQWDAEDATDDPLDIARRRSEWTNSENR